MGYGFFDIGDNFEKMAINIKDRYFRDGVIPAPGKPIDLPAIQTGGSGWPVNSSSPTSVRGMLIPAIHVKRQTSLLENAILFQFNPTEITYDKGLNYAEHQRMGFSYDIPFWVSGGAKSIRFTVMLDGTAASNAKNITNNNYSDNNNVTNGGGIRNSEYTESADGNGKGLLDIIARYEALQYPLANGNTEVVQFKNGMAQVADLKQFSSPPYVLFMYGDIGANCYVRSIGRRDILFNKKLNPIRTELDISLTVIEAKVLDKQFRAIQNVSLKP